ncbi:MAG: TonB-dependent receptor plug domain-containing protein [Psychrobacter sp.]|uniref:TonB-dependent receptor plug domain-containing protein n=5 Tax=Psychrobacter TaxID=497 RepID=UPI0017882118|nr:TonB-dependent receptor [Psychrobacter sp. FME13]MBE0441116.1 TonB-dependent receptor [Psychrobacter sp. FME13]
MSIFTSKSLITRKTVPNLVSNYANAAIRQPLLSRHPLAIGIALALSVLTPLSAQAASLETKASLSNTNNDTNNDISNDTTDDQGMPSAQLDPIVVTATRSDRTLSDAPVRVQILNRQKLDDNHAHTLKDALALLPNVYLSEVHGKTGYQVSMQGFTGDQVLVLIDGLPITASTNSTVNLNQYMNVDIEQIEVVQGAASAQFGSAAMGGVINIITKPISETKGHITTEIASNGKQNPSGNNFDANKRYVEASIEGALDEGNRIHARLSGSYLDDAGLSLDPDAWAQLKDASEQSQVSARLSYTPDGQSDKAIDSKTVNSEENTRLISNSQYWVEASQYKEDDTSLFDYYSKGNYLDYQTNEDITRQRFSIGARADIAPHSNDRSKTYKLSGQALYEDYQSDSESKNGQTVTTDRDTNITTTLAQAQLDFPALVLSDDHTHLLQIGGQLQKDELTQTNNQVSELTEDDVSRDVGEMYLQDDWLIGDNWEILSGIRYQDDEDFGDHVAPKVAVKYNYLDASGREHSFRSSIGGGYRVPNLKERYYIFDHSNYGYKVTGNSELEPETSTSYQVGYQSQLSDTLNLSINGFYNDIKDLIQVDDAVIVNGIAVYKYMNVESAETYGGDIGLNWWIDDNAKLQANYAYIHTHNNTTDSELTYQPNHKAMLALDYQINDQVQLIPRLNYESEQLIDTSEQSYSPSWWTFDTKINYDATANLSLYAAINNIFDVQRDAFDDNDYSPLDNREWLVGASYHW